MHMKPLVKYVIVFFYTSYNLLYRYCPLVVRFPDLHRKSHNHFKLCRLIPQADVDVVNCN